MRTKRVLLCKSRVARGDASGYACIGGIGGFDYVSSADFLVSRSIQFRQYEIARYLETPRG